MSRIVGRLSNEPGQVERMLAAARLQTTWGEQALRLAGAQVGWVGWRQPNSARANGVAVVLDGAIYNRAELGRAESDARLCLDLYQRHGFVEAVQKLNGDFGLALYDEAQQTLWLARDRFGLKPLYYTHSTAPFAFASQPRALLALPGVSRAVNPQFAGLFAGAHYRYFDNNPTASPYAELAQLPAAHWLCVKAGQVATGAYWTLTDAPDLTAPEKELAEQYRSLLLDAVNLRLKTATRPAFTLSGGMDSSSVLASVVELLGAKQHAFSTTTVDATYDESAEIQSMLEPKVEQWHRVKIDMPDVLTLVGQMVAIHDEPVATATWLSHFLLCAEVAQGGFGGLFGGLGGDELNAGEFEHFWYFFADLRAAHDEARLADEVEHWALYHNHPVFQKSAAIMEATLPRLADLTHPGRCLPDRTRLERYAEAINRDYFDVRSFQPAQDHPFRSYLKNRTYQDLHRETIPCCLRAEDRQTAAQGLDNFLPFLDHRLVEFMFRIPGTLKYKQGVTKNLLREAMRGILPEETRTRVKKTGWNAPAHQWFSGAGCDLLRDLVTAQNFHARHIYQVPEVLRLIDEHEQIVTGRLQRDNHMMFFWQLVNLETWLAQVAR